MGLCVGRTGSDDQEGMFGGDDVDELECAKTLDELILKRAEAAAAQGHDEKYFDIRAQGARGRQATRAWRSIVSRGSLCEGLRRAFAGATC